MRGFGLGGVVPWVLSPLMVAMAYAQTFEFDPDMLMNLPNQPKIDIRRFNQSGAISAGSYRLQVHINDKWRGTSEVVYIDDPNNPQDNAKLCIDDDLLSKLDLKDPIKAQVAPLKSPQGCHELGAVIQDVKTVLDLSAMRLDVSLPQIYVNDRPDDYIDPATWDRGVNSAFVSYQFNHYRADNTTGDTYESYLGLNTGANLGRWNLRHQGWLRQNDQSHARYQALNTNISTNVAPLQAELTLGDFYTGGTLFDSNAMRGVQLSSDERMLPASLRGYAPTIRGIANTNAKVSIYQNNQEIYSTSVPAGAFELTNIRDIGSSGDLTVVITESDGRQSRQTIPYSSSISLLRPKQSRYDLSWGRVRHNNTHLYDDIVMQGTWQQGINNHWTLNAGVLYSPNYQSLLLGSAINTRFGAFALNAIGLQASPYNSHNIDGHQLHVQYHRRLSSTNTSIHASVRHYVDYHSLENTLRSHEIRQSIANTNHPKQRYQLSVNQPLGKDWGSLYAFFNHTTHQNQPDTRQWQVGYNNKIGSLSYGISAQRTQSDITGRWDRQYMVHASMPLGGSSTHHLNSFYTQSKQNAQLQTGLSGSFKALPYFDYGINVGYSDHPTQTTWSASANYQLALAKLSASYSKYDGGQQYSAGASGAWVLHQGGLTAANQLGETFAIVHLPHGKGASIEGNDHLVFNRKGYAIVPSLTPYRTNTLTINPSGLPYDVQLADTGTQVVPTANASILVKFDSKVGRMALLNVKLKDGTRPMMGATVLDNAQHSVSFVAQDGRVFLQDAKDTDTLIIHLGGETTCRLTYALPPRSPDVPITMVDTTCH